MKIKALAISAISMALLASCGNSGKELPKDATPTDSLSYTLGQMAAMQRSVAFEQDTTLKTTLPANRMTRASSMVSKSLRATTRHTIRALSWACRWLCRCRI